MKGGDTSTQNVFLCPPPKGYCEPFFRNGCRGWVELSMGERGGWLTRASARTRPFRCFSLLFFSLMFPLPAGGCPWGGGGQPLMPGGASCLVTAGWWRPCCILLCLPCFFPWECFLFQIFEQKQTRAGRHLGDELAEVFELFDLNHEGRKTFYNRTQETHKYIKLIQKFLKMVFTSPTCTASWYFLSCSVPLNNQMCWSCPTNDPLMSCNWKLEKFWSQCRLELDKWDSRG